MINHPLSLVHTGVSTPKVSKQAVRELAQNYVRNLAFYRRRSNELYYLLSYCSRGAENANDIFCYEDFEKYLARFKDHAPCPADESRILNNKAEFQAVFRFLHPCTRLAREEITLADNQSIVLFRYGTDKILKADGTELSHQEFENFPAFQAAAANMRATLRVSANEPLKDLFSQNDLFSASYVIVADGILVERSALIAMIDGYYAANNFYNAFHYLAPFHDTEISETVLAQLPVETAEKVRAAKREYHIAQNGDVSLDFLIGARAILREMADDQRGNVFLADQQAEERLGDLNQGLVLLFASELERYPQLAQREIQTVWSSNQVLQLSLAALLQEQPCIKLRQIYMWKFLYDHRDFFPADQPLVIPLLVSELCRAERYNFAAMFEGVQVAADRRGPGLFAAQGAPQPAAGQAPLGGVLNRLNAEIEQEAHPNPLAHQQGANNLGILQLVPQLAAHLAEQFANLPDLNRLLNGDDRDFRRG